MNRNGGRGHCVLVIARVRLTSQPDRDENHGWFERVEGVTMGKRERAQMPELCAGCHHAREGVDEAFFTPPQVIPFHLGWAPATSSVITHHDSTAGCDRSNDDRLLHPEPPHPVDRWTSDELLTLIHTSGA